MIVLGAKVGGESWVWKLGAEVGAKKKVPLDLTVTQIDDSGYDDSVFDVHKGIFSKNL